MRLLFSVGIGKIRFEHSNFSSALIPLFDRDDPVLCYGRIESGSIKFIGPNFMAFVGRSQSGVIGIG